MTTETSNARGETYTFDMIEDAWGDAVPLTKPYFNRFRARLETLRQSAAPPPAGDAEAKAVPVPTRVHLIGETAVIVGTPQRGWDEDAQDAHNCDAMGCATIGPHVLARVPFTDERAMSQAAEAQAQGGGEVVAYSEKFRASGDWSRYPIGTRAYDIQGGHWERVANGWKWCTGSTFPTPGGDAIYVAVPVRVPAPPSAPAGVDAPGSRAWMAEVCRAAALSLAAHGVRNDQLSKVADWIAQQPAAGAAMEFDGTDREVLREFIRICREHKPVGAWPGERVCKAIERAMDNEKPFRFIAEADMAPEREPSMKDADRMLSGPRRRRAPPPAAAQRQEPSDG